MAMRCVLLSKTSFNFFRHSIYIGWLGVRKSIRPVKIEWWGADVVIYLDQDAWCLNMVQLMPLHPKTSSSFASFKSWLVLPFLYRLTQVVLEKRPLNWHSSSTHTHLFNGHFSGTARVSRYQKGNTNLDFCEARDSEWQWHQLGHMQVCTSLQTYNHASTPPLSFLTGRMPFLLPNQRCSSSSMVYNIYSLLYPLVCCEQ